MASDNSMDTAPFTSGEWVGYYRYENLQAKCPMHLTLNFAQGSIRGAGIDNSGQFVIEGAYDAVNHGARWVKRYVGKHSLSYEGSCSGGEIAGAWSLNKRGQERSLQGEFRIWPLAPDSYPGDMPLKTILEEEIRRHG
jgi:hypothetical protein